MAISLQRLLAFAFGSAALGAVSAQGAEPFSISLPVACMQNMENGGHVFDPLPNGTVALILRVPGGPKLLVAYTDLDWIRAGSRAGNTGQGYPKMNACGVKADFLSPEARSGNAPTNVQLDLCWLQDFNAPPDAAECGQAPGFGIDPSKASNGLDRPFSMTGLSAQVQWTGSGVRILSYQGALSSHSSPDALAVSCHHPLFVTYLQTAEQTGPCGMPAPAQARGGVLALQQGLPGQPGQPNGRLPTQRKGWPEPESPLVLDMNGDGRLDLSSVDDDAHAIWFDIELRRTMRTGWVMPSDGLLAIDSDGDGHISNGGELFGEHTYMTAKSKLEHRNQRFANGFQALAQYDHNADGRIDGNDQIFTRLLVWRDLNTDGVSQANELSSLAESGIAHIDLAYTKTSGTKNFERVAGNELRLRSTFTMTTGATRAIYDVWFKTLKPSEIARDH